MYASLDKLLHPRLFAEVVAAYQLVPEPLVTTVAVVLPWVELVAGGLLVLGLLSLSSAAILASLSGAFAGAVTWATSRGLDISCGCFSLAGGSVGWAHLGLDLALLLAAGAVLLHGPGPLALDAALLGSREA